MGVKVAAQNEAHVGGDVIGPEEAFHLRKPRVLEVFRASNDRVGIGMRVKVLLHQSLDGTVEDHVVTSVFLLVHGLQLALEHAKDGPYESLAVELGPLLQVLR